MEHYIIATSSTCDLPRTYLDEHKIPFIQYSYTVGDQVFEDDCREENRQKVYEDMRRGSRLKTSMITEYSYYEFFKGLLEQEQDVIFLDMSQKMSASYVNACHAADKVRQEFPERKFYLMDTRCISGGLGLLVDQMERRMEAGMSYEDVIAWGEENKLKIAHRFTVDDLKYLKEGGRCSTPAALVGSLLSVKPVLYVPDEGTLDVAKKVRGRKAALDTIYAGIKADLSEVETAGLEIHILQADCRKDAEYVRDRITADFPDVAEITITSLGVVIGAHCGPGLFTIFYLCNKRRP